MYLLSRWLREDFNDSFSDIFQRIDNEIQFHYQKIMLDRYDSIMKEKDDETKKNLSILIKAIVKQFIKDKYDNNQKIAQNLLKNGIDILYVMEATSLKKDQIIKYMLENDMDISEIEKITYTSVGEIMDIKEKDVATYGTIDDLIEQEKEKMNEEFKSIIKQIENAEMERLDILIKVAEKEEAVYERKKEIAKNILSSGMDILNVMKATGLTETEVLEIQKEIN